MRTITIILLTLFLNGLFLLGNAQEPGILFGNERTLEEITAGRPTKEKPIKWINVNTDPGTWSLQKNLLVCSGQPIGIMRSEKQYENFILHVEWKHLEAGGNREYLYGAMQFLEITDYQVV